MRSSNNLLRAATDAIYRRALYRTLYIGCHWGVKPAMHCLWTETLCVAITSTFRLFGKQPHQIALLGYTFFAKIDAPPHTTTMCRSSQRSPQSLMLRLLFRVNLFFLCFCTARRCRSICYTPLVEYTNWTSVLREATPGRGNVSPGPLVSQHLSPSLGHLAKRREPPLA